jgi:hypothetical protein
MSHMRVHARLRRAIVKEAIPFSRGAALLPPSSTLELRGGRDAAQLVGNLSFIASWSSLKAGGPEVIRQPRATSECLGFITQTRMDICLIKEAESIVLPLLRIDRLAAAKVLECLVVFAEMPMNFSATAERNRLRIEFDDLVQIFKSTSRLANLHPSKVAIEIGMRIPGIFANPFLYDPEVALRVGSENLLKRQNLLRRCWIFHRFIAVICGHVTHPCCFHRRIRRLGP